jgi:hypothetical protein
MSAPVIFKIDSKGTATFLKTPITEAMFPEATDHRRASHVYPMSLPLRILFRALRGAFGDEGRVSEWTRNWYCLWQVDLSPVGGETYGWFETRKRAIAFEVEWLHKNFLKV